mgnify:CR=1 FL=1
MATISNIHYNLTAWSSGQVVTVGKRVSSSNNAYQALNSGTTGAVAPTGTSTVSDGNITWQYLSHIDYTSIQSWVNGWPTTLSTDLIGQLWNNGVITTTSDGSYGIPFMSANGVNVGTFNVTLTCAPGESFRDTLLVQRTPLSYNANAGVAFITPSVMGQINYFYVNIPNFTLDGIQIKDPIPNSVSTLILFDAAANKAKVKNCIIDGTAQNDGASLVSFSGNGDGVYNTLLIDRQKSTANIPVMFTSNGEFINSTIYAINKLAYTGSFFCGIVGSSSNTDAVVIKNSMILYYANTATGPSTNSILMANTITTTTSINEITTDVRDGGGNIYNVNVNTLFIDSNSNFLLSNTSLALGKGLIANTYIPTNDDICKNPRKQNQQTWDIGPTEYVRTRYDSISSKIFFL